MRSAWTPSHLLMQAMLRTSIHTSAQGRKPPLFECPCYMEREQLWPYLSTTHLLSNKVIVSSGTPCRVQSSQMSPVCVLTQAAPGVQVVYGRRARPCRESCTERKQNPNKLFWSLHSASEERQIKGLGHVWEEPVRGSSGERTSQEMFSS